MFRCTSLALPAGADIKRESVRPVAFREPAHEQEFDSSTLLYDAFVLRHERGSHLVFIGPPFFNLFPLFCSSKICGRPMASTISNYYQRDRCSEVWIAKWNSETVELEFGFGSYRLALQASANDIYKGRRVLYTLSKNNEVRWIIDWIEFHNRLHGADAVLIYDNASSLYTGEELEQSLREVFPRLEVNVVHWPYKYGPRGNPRDTGWDSDFCQAGAFQDARFRFLGLASSVLNCDIDELVLSSREESIFEATERRRGGCTMFTGQWISNVTAPNQASLHSGSHFRHSDFRYLERGASCPMKWCVVPRRCNVEAQWGTHTVFGKDVALCYSSGFSYRHFRGVSTNWKYERGRPEKFCADLHQPDDALDAAFASPGMARVGENSGRSLREMFRWMRVRGSGERQLLRHFSGLGVRARAIGKRSWQKVLDFFQRKPTIS